MKRLSGGGGWQALLYTFHKGRQVGFLRLWRAMRSKNACKTCALGMGGQLGGMRNEAGHFPEVCKKSLQAMVADMQGRIAPEFFTRYTLEELRGLSPRELESLGRLADPLIASPGDTHYRVAAWDEALDLVGDALRRTPPDRSFFYASGRSSNEAGFLLSLLARAYGTNHVSNCSYYCHQASGEGLHASIGAKTATVDLADLERCDLLFLIGGNPASNHPRLMTQLASLRSRGGKIVVVNPLRELGLSNFRVPSNPRSLFFGSEIASVYVQPTIGGDIAFMAGVAKRLFEAGSIDREFLEHHTEGSAALQAHLQALTWEEIERESGVGREEIGQIAGLYAKSERTIFAWTMGITHHLHGVENVRWIANLALLRGMIGKPGAGLLPIRGHSNVQGMGSMGVSPAVSAAVLARVEALGMTPPSQPGQDTLAALEAAAKGEKDFGFMLGGNLYGASPDAGFVEALAQVGTLVSLTTSLNTGHVQGRGRTMVVLPVLARDEEPQSTTQESMFNYVRLSDGGPARHEGPRAETDVLGEIALRVLGSEGAIDWNAFRNHDSIRALIADLLPELEPIRGIGETKREFEIPGRVLHTPKFTTESGRARLTTAPNPEQPPIGPNELRLMTIRSEGQFNTVVYEEEDLYRAQERRDVILMSPEDREEFGFGVDERVDVASSVGVVRSVLVREWPIARGCAAMYYPEANALVPRAADPRSKTPSFKHVVVTVRPAADPTLVRLGGDAIPRGRLNAC